MIEFRLKPERTELLPHIGAPVCLVMKDGSFKIGQLTGCRGGKISLNGPADRVRAAAITRKPGKSGKRTGKTRANAAKPAARTPATAPLPEDNHPHPAWQGPQFAPLSLEPLPAPPSAPQENVPLHTVDSIFLL